MMTALASLAARPLDWGHVPLTRYTIRRFVEDALHGFSQESEHADYVIVSDAIVAQIDRPLTWDEGAYLVRAIKSERLMQTATALRRPFRVFG